MRFAVAALLAAAGASGVRATAQPSRTVDAPHAYFNDALGVTCEYCHAAGDWTSAEKRPHQTVTTMSALFEEFPEYMPPTARTQCFMCHQGATHPAR